MTDSLSGLAVATDRETSSTTTSIDSMVTQVHLFLVIYMFMTVECLLYSMRRPRKNKRYLYRGSEQK